MEKTVTYKKWLELVPTEWCAKYDLRFILDKERVICLEKNTYLHLPEKFIWANNKVTNIIRTKSFTLTVWKNIKKWQISVFHIR